MEGVNVFGGGEKQPLGDKRFWRRTCENMYVRVGCIGWAKCI